MSERSQPQDARTGAGSVETDGRSGASSLERLASFRFTYLAFACFLALYLISVSVLETALDTHFRSTLTENAILQSQNGPLVSELRNQLGAALDSKWIRPGGVRVDALAIAADGHTLLFVHPGAVPSLPAESTVPSRVERTLFPAKVRVNVSVPHNSLAANVALVSYAALFLTTLLLYMRILTRRENERLRAVVEARDGIARRAAQIENELVSVRDRLSQVEPVRASQESAIHALRDERTKLLTALHDLEGREEALRQDSGEVDTLRTEHEALEGLLDETLGDLAQRDEEVRELHRQLKRQNKTVATEGRQADQLSRRLSTLYKNIEIDDNAVKDLIALRDESLKLKAEEALKRLSDESDQVAVRRKVGGLPPFLSILELGYAGKGRIYYTKGTTRRFRILRVGTKASQKPDIEYLSRLPRGT
ncbi:MAG: hypothetical protein OEP95_00470 [Myxococcales bacterium]|nr:hypothetical protein [Myxococcales bacterium]